MHSRSATGVGACARFESVWAPRSPWLRYPHLHACAYTVYLPQRVCVNCSRPSDEPSHPSPPACAWHSQPSCALLRTPSLPSSARPPPLSHAPSPLSPTVSSPRQPSCRTLLPHGLVASPARVLAFDAPSLPAPLRASPPLHKGCLKRASGREHGGHQELLARDGRNTASEEKGGRQHKGMLSIEQVS